MGDKYQRSPMPALDMVLSLCGDEGIEFNGEKFVPDSTKGFFTFKFSHAFPVATIYQTALHPNVIAKSYNSLKFQTLNYEHQIAAYSKDGKDVRDRVIGSVVAVDFPRSPMGGWKIDANADNAPGISGVAVVYKQTQGMADLMGQHLTGRKSYTVSMEVFYPFQDAGFAVELSKAVSTANGPRPAGFADPAYDFTPSDMLASGYEYVPVAKAPGELVATFSTKKNRVVAAWKGRKCTVLMGGLNNPVHYAGAGVVRFGAERTAKIQRLAASDYERLDEIFSRLGQAVAKVGSIIGAPAK
jgi:hypothetical protein